MVLSTIVIAGCVVIGIGFLITFFIIAKSQYQQKNWQRTSAQILSKKILRKWYHIQPRSSSTQYYVVLKEYKYEVDGTTYVQKETTGPELPLRAKIISYQTEVGSNITIYYNPKKPIESTMMPGIKKSTYYYLGFSICWIMAAGLIFGLRLMYINPQ